jgi:hypothetical protein
LNKQEVEKVRPPQWKFYSTYDGQQHLRGVSEGSVVRAANNDLVAALRIDMPASYYLDGGPYNDDLEGTAVSISNDNGVTWSPLDILFDAGRHHANLQRLPNNDLVMTLVVREDIRTGPGLDTCNRGCDALISRDNGLTWNLDRRITLDEFEYCNTSSPPYWVDSKCGHVASTVLTDGTMLTAYGNYLNGSAVLIKWDPSAVPIPEPGTWSLLMMGVVAALIRAGWRHYGFFFHCRHRILMKSRTNGMRRNQPGVFLTRVDFCAVMWLTAWLGGACFGQNGLSPTETPSKGGVKNETAGERVPQELEYLHLLSGSLLDTGNNGSTISTDGGRTWSAATLHHPYHFPTTQALANTTIQLQSGPHKGRILRPYFTSMEGEHCDYSRAQRGGYAIWKGKKILLETGTHVPEMNASFVCFSDDEGKTWRLSQGYLMGYFDDGARGVWSCEEPVIAELRDGRILCFMRSQCGRILKSYSSDGGETWTKVEATDLAASYSPCALARLPKSGDLALVWNQVSAEEICKGYRRSRLSIAVSKDDGRTWQNFKTIEQSPGLENATRIDPPKLEPNVRGPSGPDTLLSELPDGFMIYHYPTIHVGEDKIYVRYLMANVAPPNTSRTRAFPISWLYEE